MKKPDKAHYERRRDTSFLYEEGYKEPFGEFYMRGGISWPEMVDSAEKPTDYHGYALLGGQDVESKNKTVYIFEQRPFEVVETVLTNDGDVKYDGLARWFNESWADYFASKFFWHQDEEIHRCRIFEVGRSAFVQPKPQFIFVPWHDAHETNATWGFVKREALRWDEGSQLDQELHRTKAGDKHKAPAVHALQCLLAGIERYPWRGEGR